METSKTETYMISKSPIKYIFSEIHKIIKDLNKKINSISIKY